MTTTITCDLCNRTIGSGETAPISLWHITTQHRETRISNGTSAEADRHICGKCAVELTTHIAGEWQPIDP